MNERYAVVVRHNLVQEIRRCPAAGPRPEVTPLEVASRLARNNLDHGCIDGEYVLENASHARVFALMCLGFTRALVDRRQAAIEALGADAPYRAEDDAPATGTGTGPG